MKTLYSKQFGSIEDWKDDPRLYSFISFLVGFMVTMLIIASYLQTPLEPEIKPVIVPSITPTTTPTPTPRKAVQWKGKVSHYSRAGCLGCSENLTMANGQTLDDSKPTIAFNGLPMNTKVKITNLDNGKSIVATVTDTGGFNRYNRIADLVPAVYEYLETKTDRSIVVIEKL